MRKYSEATYNETAYKVGGRKITGDHKGQWIGAWLVLLSWALTTSTPVWAALAVEAKPTPSTLGKKIFNDPGLSASGQMSCATCHDPTHAYAQNNSLHVQFGGANLDTAGFRSVPSLRYMSFTPHFYFDEEGTPTGGFNRDGRASDLIEQAARPFLAPHEMANESLAHVVARLQAAPYAEEFRQLFGPNIFANSDAAFQRMRFALAQFQKQDVSFHPFDSKYDAFLAGKLRLDAAELRGLALFNRSDKGNCAGCHPSGRGPNGEPPLFTDFTYDNLGVPRNAKIPATADPNYFDLGLCGPDRTDLIDRFDLCGAFKVPTLRNVATRRAFFHNGLFNNLHDTLRFYVRRDTHPQEFYPNTITGVLKFDDLPSVLRTNVNIQEVPYDRLPGQSPRLSETELEDLEAFLNTLTDSDQLN